MPPISGIASADSPVVTKELAMTRKYTGRCACGAVKFEFDTDPTFIADCYCKDCQKASGSAMATFCVAYKKVVSKSYPQNSGSEESKGGDHVE
jgi:hypothetical protein